MTGEPLLIVVDDDLMVCKSVVALADSMGIRSQVFHSAEDFLNRFDRTQTGCLVLDVRLNGMSGLELLEAMRDLDIRVPTIIVTGFADVPLAVRAMRAGALGVLEKPYRAQELWDTIRQALAINSQIRESDERRAFAKSQLASLSSDERNLLDLIMSGKTNKGIAQDLSLGLRTVELRRQSLMTKMKATSLVELITLVTEARMRRD